MPGAIEEKKFLVIITGRTIFFFLSQQPVCPFFLFYACSLCISFYMCQRLPCLPICVCIVSIILSVVSGLYPHPTPPHSAAKRISSRIRNE